jgi:hypothetical protein
MNKGNSGGKNHWKTSKNVIIKKHERKAKETPVEIAIAKRPKNLKKKT